MNLNKVIIVGRLTQDPEKKVIPDSGTTITTFSVATNTYFKDKSGERQERTEFHNIVLFGNVAEIAAKYLQKGSLALFEGRLQTRTWDDKDGNKRYRTEIVADTIQLGPRNEGSGGNRQQGGSAKQDSSSQQKEKNIPVIDEDDDINIEDIPF
jgi:single-strand DNA-binding protein